MSQEMPQLMAVRGLAMMMLQPMAVLLPLAAMRQQAMILTLLHSGTLPPARPLLPRPSVSVSMMMFSRKGVLLALLMKQRLA